jgi:hypothetical protein
MESESRPGIAGRIYLGGNYAQPSVSYDAIPGGNEMTRIETYLGNRNSTAPWTSTEEQQAENRAETGGKKDVRTYEQLILMRAYAVRDSLREVFGQGTANV